MDVAPPRPLSLVPPPAVPAPVIEPPLSPRTRALVVGLRRVLLLAADVLGEYAGLPPREAGVK